ncbi:Alpha/beta hydrolase fold protein OS=Tsukamurella paurometabola (strain ATCC 8368 / DSM / CCUG 35730 / CIP 100753 / JCM 10117 / KCTC 9821 / NBRC 16120 /NCIMB 702349 / NCTC 13040) OX=521096 GN=Tpau_3635 PE=3 SV=1 [Tsukamurella paurometabola]|uniref:Alpha/beta hydrolase fold protein n=1 Tax=Tsukamurella paurometabola (strain ATCC 8368 / DSM 20162 / CCUG 35730 / CIP 100753 / JCM 10117 / KCTC 9821 / NBRC 16120 / NCIMB 702349 / NCTC 13040) TaxID=521096 RepID=D5UXX6_TSUPD|nr:alpha/beta fold hydrolase [Tsukamurella paurometabola]ADG80213.1 alpha/beta hydrolase fold protein [Tsukamurella paurometabola DSM 20162]SUP38862.1 Haloacetate dehalogenase H-1 [Tsukamurella paurometabola]
MTERITSFQRAGLTFPVVDTGPIGGEIVVLLHGFPQTPTSWEGTAAALHERGYRTVIPWQRGYSATAKPKRRYNYRSSELVADIAGLLRLTGPAHLVGHDWGAATAWQVAAEHPAAVRTLTTVSVPHPMAFLRSFISSDQALRSYYMVLFQIPVLPELLAARRPDLFARFLRRSGMPEEALNLVFDEIVSPGLLGGGLNWYRGMPFVGTRPPNTSVTSPTTHVWSSGDIALSRKGAELAQEYVDAPFRLVVLDGVSHWIPDERPDELAELIVENATAHPSE